jgi:hypothetical protein
MLRPMVGCKDPESIGHVLNAKAQSDGTPTSGNWEYPGWFLITNQNKLNKSDK